MFLLTKLLQKIKDIKIIFNSFIVSENTFLSFNFNIFKTIPRTRLQLKDIEIFLNEESNKKIYYNLLKGESQGLLDTPTEYYKKSEKERCQMMKNNFEVLFINLFLIYCLFVFDSFNQRQTIENIFLLPNTVRIILTFVYSLFALDFSTGMTHLTLDNPITKIHPISIVRNAAWQFQDHHDNPTDTTNPPLLHVLLNKGRIYSLFLSDLLVISILFNKSMSMFGLFVYLLGFLAEWNHRVIHTNLTPKHYFHNITMWLMKRGVLMNPQKHYLHHQTYDVNFCTLTGWTDRLVNYINKNYIIKNSNNFYHSRMLVVYMMINFYIIIPLGYMLLQFLF